MEDEPLQCIGAADCPDERCSMVKDYIEQHGRQSWEDKPLGVACGVMEEENRLRPIVYMGETISPKRTRNAGMKFKKAVA